MKKIFQTLLSLCLVSGILAPALPANASMQEAPQVKSKTAILIDQKTGNVLYNKKDSKKMYPASITKIVTAILAIESGKMDEMVTVSRDATLTDGTRVYLSEGEQLPLRKLVEGMMVNSGNDAAVAIAEYLTGDIPSFADQMNEFAKKAGAVHTHFVTPNGLYDPEHYTTAEDMAKITQAAMKNKEFQRIVSIKNLPWHVKGWDTTLVNHHRLLWDYPGVTGVKNGYVSQAKHTLVTSVSRNGMDFIAVVLKAPSSKAAYRDTISLFEYGFTHFQRQKLSKGTKIEDSTGKEHALKKDLEFTLPMGEHYTKKVFSNGDLRVQDGNGKELATVKLFHPSPKKATSRMASSTAQKVKEITPLQLTTRTAVFFYSLFLLLVSCMVIVRMRKKKRKAQRMKRLSKNYTYVK
ncbi:D-alanyl-D-alanine carboxypeptidase family protein [Fictibacillus terranigra]|uniref:D-alanyl-D-alanine carboxypeptidase family protein n=1 Tax=Fictibacillus terranigra TaxID=3058424 RepID=A0ABT8EDX0_9BACL|nr:D-alanyl-D-alanine carboxypeptidase family protein [Fictibacillus sp. CENA-BCM004]MDN4076125.1 D-alanyl-D-alanine carboxypeptidase family protein [Fictibacillus sp. CENA-BCM004]